MNCWKCTLAKYPRVLYVKPSNKMDILYSVHSMYMSDKWRSKTKDSEMLQILKTKSNSNEKEEILYWTRTRKKKTVWRGFVIITIILKTKRKTAKTVSHVFKKKKVKEGLDYICSLWCLVNYYINWEKHFFPCVSQSTRCMLLLAQTWMKARLEQCKENS